MNIQINDVYSLQSDPLNFIIMRKYRVKKGKNAGKDAFEPVGYFPRLSQALRHVLELDLMQSDIDTISGLYKRIQAFEDKIDRIDAAQLQR